MSSVRAQADERGTSAATWCRHLQAERLRVRLRLPKLPVNVSYVKLAALERLARVSDVRRLLKVAAGTPFEELRAQIAQCPQRLSVDGRGRGGRIPVDPVVKARLQLRRAKAELAKARAAKKAQAAK